MSDKTTGLYGSQTGLNATTAAIAEFIGTTILVLAIIATVSAAALSASPAGPAFNELSIVLANGLALTAMVAALGHISGAHFNPAVTLGLAVTGHFPWRYTPGYIIAQFAGAIVAALITLAFYGTQAVAKAHLGATAPAPHVSGLLVLFVEAVITFVLMFVVMAVATDERTHNAVAPVAVGFGLAAAVFIGLPLTGAGVNPARAIGPMIVSGHFTDWWAYLVGPIIGGILAALVYYGFIGRAEAPA